MLMTTAFAAPGHATALFGVDPNPGGTQLNLDNAKDVTDDAGMVVSKDDVMILVTGASDFAGGNATIKPSGSAPLTDLIFTPVDPTEFDSFSFRGQDNEADQAIDVIVTDQAGQTESFTDTVAKANQDFTRFGVIALQPGETIKSVELQNSGGFKQAKQFDFDLAPIPEPSTWAMMLLGAGAVGAALRGKRRIAPRSV
jgi:hypothetical protein